MHKMTMRTRREYLKQLKQRYLKAGKKQKGAFLDEAAETTGLHRNYLIEQLSPWTDLDWKDHRPRKPRTSLYSNEVIYYLKKIWDVLDCPCGQRMVGSMLDTLDALERHGELIISDMMRKKLLEVSASTIDRRLRRFKVGRLRRLHGSTKPGSLLKKQIPIELSRWNETELGHSELDLVAHNGGDPEGDFANTLTDTDLASAWTEQEAFLGKSEKRVIYALAAIDGRRPFDRKSIDTDSGGEFINWQLWRHCKANDVIFTRGRPGKKNDNAHVEEKNWTHVRKLVGYHRYDTKRQVDLLNDLYRNEWRLYENFFQATLKLTEKKRIGGHLQKKYARAKTPYQRIMESSEVAESIKTKLKAQFLLLNPAELKRQIEKKLEALKQTVRARKAQQSETHPEKQRTTMRLERVAAPEMMLTLSSGMPAAVPSHSLTPSSLKS